MNLTVTFNEESGVLSMEHGEFGEENGFHVTSSKGGIFVEAANVKEEFLGADVEGTINGEAATGRGQFLMGNDGNFGTDGLVIAYTGDQIGPVGNVSVLQNSLKFQVGPNTNQKTSVAIESTHSTSLARGVTNDSGFENLSSVDVTTSQGAQDTIRLVDEAINQLSSVRGKLGAVQKNTLESNTATLRVTAENLIAAESSIRDTDIAFELANFTRNKILTETAAATAAQASNINASTVFTLFDR